MNDLISDIDDDISDLTSSVNSIDTSSLTDSLISLNKKIEELNIVATTELNDTLKLK